MKKLVTILVIAGFMLATTAPLADAGGRRHYRGHRHRTHIHHRHHYHSGDHFWIGLGVGVLTGAIVSSFYYSPPPPRRVVYYVEPETVVVHRAPTVVVPPQRKFGTALPATYGQVTVTPAALNLRSGPGVEHDVLGRVLKGEVLDVISSQPGWFYVRTPKGSYGWVMDQYTKPALPVG